jgi:simple sugar transport system ATP-binding protein
MPPSPAPAAHRISRIEMCDIIKRFPGVLANDGVCFDVTAGEVHALLGENGAGKSTLMRQLYGMYQPDEGDILLDGRKVAFHSPADAINAGIGMIHQHFMLVPTLTVTQNVALGLRSSREPMLDLAKVAARVTELSRAYGLKVEPDAYVWQLSVGEQQWVEILKALYHDAELLILDEPTAVLTPQESARLFSVIRAMRTRGLSVVIITHKLAEVMQSDRVTVLRKGRKVATVDTATTTAEALTELMIGRAIGPRLTKSTREPGRVVVQAANLVLKGVWGETLVDNVSLTVRAGEILGIAGVAGNGQKPLLEMLAGITPPLSGSIAVGDRQLEGAWPAQFIEAGVGIIPEDRFAEGLVGPFSIADNIILGSQRSPDIRPGSIIDYSMVRQRADAAMAEYAIAAPDIATPVANLSGGNAQKVILARELRQARVLLLANQPTRGLDVGIVSVVHARLLEKREQGCAIVLASEDLDDLLALSDRLAVMFAGRIVAVLDPATASIEQIGALMAGRPEQRA